MNNTPSIDINPAIKYTNNSSWKRGFEDSPVKFATLLFYEKFNGAPIAGSTFHSDRQGVKGPSACSPTILQAL